MSGTSLDGMDAALVRFYGPTRAELLGFAHRAYTPEERGLLETTLVVWMGDFGRTPTTGLRDPLLEVVMFDFDGDLYGRHMRVDFLHKFRDEEKYADIATLTRQIALDVDHARVFFRDGDAGQARR